MPKVVLAQGRVLGPLLFMFFCGDMFNDCFDEPFIYADDSTLVTAAKTTAAAHRLYSEITA